MAQSIKLNNDMYWDISAIKGMCVFTINGGASKSVYLPSGFRGILVSIGLVDGANTRGAWYLSAQGSGAINYRAVDNSNASNLAFTTSTNTLTIANNSNASTYGATTFFVIGNTNIS